MAWLDYLQPQANAAAIEAAGAAVDNLSQRPFSVVLSISPDTQSYIALLLFGALVAGVMMKRKV